MLISLVGGVGASSRPCVNAAATCHADTTTTATPNRRRTAAAPAPTAATASARGEPAGAAGAGSASNSCTNRVNAMKTRSELAAIRPSQPRTVDTGRPTHAETLRYPHPRARASSADPITSAASARRTNAVSGDNTCVRPHDPQIDRRGTTRSTGHTEPGSDLNDRGLARPHGRNTPRQSGHLNAPDNNSRSTTPISGPTVTTVPPRTTRTALPTLRQEITGGPSPIPT